MGEWHASKTISATTTQRWSYFQLLQFSQWKGFQPTDGAACSGKWWRWKGGKRIIDRWGNWRCVSYNPFCFILVRAQNICWIQLSCPSWFRTRTLMMFCCMLCPWWARTRYPLINCCCYFFLIRRYFFKRKYAMPWELGKTWILTTTPKCLLFSGIPAFQIQGEAYSRFQQEGQSRQDGRRSLLGLSVCTIFGAFPIRVTFFFLLSSSAWRTSGSVSVSWSVRLPSKTNPGAIFLPGVVFLHLSYTLKSSFFLS